MELRNLRVPGQVSQSGPWPAGPAAIKLASTCLQLALLSRRVEAAAETRAAFGGLLPLRKLWCLPRWHAHDPFDSNKIVDAQWSHQHRARIPAAFAFNWGSLTQRSHQLRASKQDRNGPPQTIF